MSQVVERPDVALNAGQGERGPQVPQRMVATWLERYMFRRRDDAPAKAEAVARFFADLDPDDRLGSHGRAIGIDKYIELELNVVDMRKNPALRQRVRELTTPSKSPSSRRVPTSSSRTTAATRTSRARTFNVGVGPGFPGPPPPAAIAPASETGDS